MTGSGGGHAGGLETLTISLPTTIQGLDFYEQVFLIDAASPSGVASSNGLFVHIGG